MKELNEMTHVEIASLSPDEIETLCDYECARNGVKLMIFPKEPVKKVFKPDLEVYEVGDFRSEDKSVIERIATFLADIRPHLCKVDYDYKIGSEYKYVTRNLSEWDHKVEVKKIMAFNSETYDRMKNEIQQHSTEMSEFERERKSFTENKSKREKTCEWITDKVFAHKRLQKKIDSYQETMKKYLELANGDRLIAANFFEKAIGEDENGSVAEYIKKTILFPEMPSDDELNNAVDWIIENE